MEPQIRTQHWPFESPAPSVLMGAPCGKEKGADVSFVMFRRLRARGPNWAPRSPTPSATAGEEVSRITPAVSGSRARAASGSIWTMTS